MKKFCILLFLIALVLHLPAQTPAPAATPTPAPAAAANQQQAAKPKVHAVRFVYYAGVRYILLQDIASYYRLSVRYLKTGVIMYSKTRRLTMSYTKREGFINGSRIYFLAPVLYLDKRAYISENDFLKVIDPIFKVKLPIKHPVKTIIVVKVRINSGVGLAFDKQRFEVRMNKESIFIVTSLSTINVVLQ